MKIYQSSLKIITMSALIFFSVQAYATEKYYTPANGFAYSLKLIEMNAALEKDEAFCSELKKAFLSAQVVVTNNNGTLTFSDATKTFVFGTVTGDPSLIKVITTYNRDNGLQPFTAESFTRKIPGGKEQVAVTYGPCRAIMSREKKPL